MKRYLFIPLLFVARIYAIQADVSVYFSPKGGCEQAIMQAINDAKKNILIAMYQFSDYDIITAVKEAKKRGVDIEIIVDGDAVQNFRELMEELISAGIPVKFTFGKGIMHNKFAVIDTKIVITGSYNWTKNAREDNFENLLVIKSPEIALIYAKEFAKIKQTAADLPAGAVRGGAEPEYKYVASKYSKVFHYIWCPLARKIAEKNRIYFKTREEAIKSGRRPCRKCRP